MKKTSLFLSVAWLAMATVSVANEEEPEKAFTAGADAAEGVRVESPVAAAPAKLTRVGSLAQGLRKIMRVNSEPRLATPPLLSPSEKDKALASPAEADDAYDLKKSINALETTDGQKITAFKDLLPKVGKNRVGSAFSSSKKCRTWGGYRAELVAGRDFYGSNCAKEFCSQYCAPVKPEQFWAKTTLGETVCAFRCARGVSMGEGNARLRAAYDATKGRTVWGGALTHWQGLEGASVVNRENLVNADTVDALRSAKAIEAFKSVDKIVANSSNPAIKQAETQYTGVVNKFITAVVDLLAEVQKTTTALQKKTKDLATAAEAVIDTRTSVERNLDTKQLESVFNTAKDAAVKKVKDAAAKAKIDGLNHSDVETTLATLAKEASKNLTTILDKGQQEVAEVEGGSGEGPASTGTPKVETPAKGTEAASPAASAASPAASRELTDIESGLQAIINEKSEGNARGEARKEFIDGHQDKGALKRALVEISAAGGPLAREAGSILSRKDMESVVLQ